MMTKKTFIQVAQTIAQIKNKKAKLADFERWSAVFAADNPRFDKEKFRVACLGK